jgi:hypothetical protein
MAFRKQHKLFVEGLPFSRAYFLVSFGTKIEIRHLTKQVGSLGYFTGITSIGWSGLA